ncbi:hypothetical protein [Fusibacter tunisiensis]|uniref:hypothetical protein n=1 Tax=Fusibacter tunisiensis TaxID=1008308 RepID=UPI001FAFB47A|nr:hypothetical protein [Fusibacter tunisiensis]
MTHFGMDTLGELVGNKALTGFTAPKILWLKKISQKFSTKIAEKSPASKPPCSRSDSADGG